MSDKKTTMEMKMKTKMKMSTKMKKRRLISVLLIFSLTLTMILGSFSLCQGAAYTGKYWLKVNEQCNVVTAYKKIDGKWKPVRAMLCSTGLNGSTPKGTFYTKGKWNWGELINDVYGQYCTHITGDILFHSVYYMEKYDKSSQATRQFNRLGSAASHGCIRLSVMDAKWIYKTCKVGTKVTIYRSKNPGPLGKPSGIKVKYRGGQYWDPTDPDSRNPFFIMKKPVITVSAKKKLTVQYGSKYNLKDYVYAKDPNTFMNLKSYLKVSKVQRFSVEKNKYVTADFSVNKLGTYKVTYSVKDPYGRSASKTIKIRVRDNMKAPVISGAENRTVTAGDSDAIGKVTAKQASAGRTKQIVTLIKAPGSSKFISLDYAAAKAYTFDTPGEYTVKYTVKNKYSPYKGASKTVVITVEEKPGETYPLPEQICI